MSKAEQGKSGVAGHHERLWGSVPQWGRLWGLAEMLGEVRTTADLVRLREARLFAAERLQERRELTPLSAKRLTGFWIPFERFAAAHGVDLVHDVTTGLVGGFVRALTRVGVPPAVATMHLRRDALRLWFKVLCEFGIAPGDPTVGVVLPPRLGLGIRPLTDDEVEQCRWSALSTVTATRQPALWALGEAGASTREIARVACADIDLTKGRVWLHGAPRTDARWAPLTEWGALQLARRTRDLRIQPASLVAFDRPVDEHAGRIGAGQTLAAIMARAGLADDREVKPRSLAAWVGRRVWLETGQIDEAARRLGLRSLDLAAELVGFNWRTDQDQA